MAASLALEELAVLPRLRVLPLEGLLGLLEGDWDQLVPVALHAPGEHLFVVDLDLQPGDDLF